MDRLIRCCLVLAVAGSLVSVFLCGLFLGAATLAWFLQCVTDGRLRLKVPPYFPFVLLFLACVVLSIFFSEDVWVSSRYVKKFVHFLAAALVFTYFDRRLVKITMRAIMVTATVSAGIGVFQYFVLERVSLLGRATGFMSHWMTFSGQLMIVAILMGAAVVTASFRGREANRAAWGVSLFRAVGWKWPLIAALLLILFTLVLTMTRSAWLGCTVGLAVVLAARNYRLVLGGGLAVLLIWLMLPERFNQRLVSSFDPRDTTNRVRFELLHTGVNMIRAHPWLGVGPRMIPNTYSSYRVTHEFPGWAYQHLHNNVVQIAAEMGLLALGAWLAIWAKLVVDQIGAAKRALKTADMYLFGIAVGALGALTAFLTAGLFEYNFGDSEILTLLLFAATAPYVCLKDFDDSSGRIKVDTVKAGMLKRKVSKEAS